MLSVTPAGKGDEPGVVNTSIKDGIALATPTSGGSSPFFNAQFSDPPKSQSAPGLPPMQNPAKASRDGGFGPSAVVDSRKPPVVDRGGENLLVAPAQSPSEGSGGHIPRDPVAGMDALVSLARADSQSSLVDSSTSTAGSREPGAAASSTTPTKEGPADAGEERPVAPPAVPQARQGGLADRAKNDAPATRSDAGQGADGVAPAVGVAATGTTSAAFSEDLAYVHRGSALKSYAITGSVLVAAPRTGAILRVTDEHGHIATAAANAAIAEETASVAPARLYSCKAGPAKPAGVPAHNYHPALMYRCSPAVKALPVRVSCSLRTAGTAVLVRAQVIANPVIPQPLSGVLVLVHLPFSPRQEQVRRDTFFVLAIFFHTMDAHTDCLS